LTRRPRRAQHAADRGQAEREQREDAGRRRDVAECDREGAEHAERSAELLGVAELREVGLVACRFARRFVMDVHIWSWPIVAAGQFIVALGFAELSSHYPVAGSVFQWTKYLSGKTYSWFAGWMALYVIYGFDTASTLAEETRNPRKEAPKAVLGSVIGAFVIGGIFLFACLLAIPDLNTAIKEGWGPAQIIDANFGNAFSTVFLLVVSAAIFVCCLAIETSTIRLAFGMSRDDRLPGSKTLSKVHPTLHTPIGACLAVGILAFVPMLQFAGAAIVAIAATGMIYLSYLLANIALLRARLRGWPRADAPFKLGKWGLPTTIAALVSGGAMFVNIAWPRALTNPSPNQTGLALNFHWGWLDDQPVLWTVLIVVALVGAVYFVAVQRNKPSHLEAPEGEVFATDAPAVAEATT
jgi:amino acid transporter